MVAQSFHIFPIHFLNACFKLRLPYSQPQNLTKLTQLSSSVDSTISCFKIDVSTNVLQFFFYSLFFFYVFCSTKRSPFKEHFEPNRLGRSLPAARPIPSWAPPSSRWRWQPSPRGSDRTFLTFGVVEKIYQVILSVLCYRLNCPCCCMLSYVK